MSASLVLICDGRKFLWNGQPYDTRDEASKAADACQRDGFEIRLIEDAGTFLVYTRRVVKQVAVT